jgi:hypothetical protein
MPYWGEEMDSRWQEPSVVLVTSRVSKKERECAACGGEIKPGQRYERVFLPPDAEHDKSFTMVQHVGNGACIFGRL